MIDAELDAIEARAKKVWVEDYSPKAGICLADIPALVAEVRRYRDANYNLMDKLESATGGEEVFIQVVKP